MGVVVAVNLVPREQHLCLFSSLYGLRREVDACVLVGERFRSEVSDFLFEQLEGSVTVVYQEPLLPVGLARVALLGEVGVLGRYLGAEWVLFLDDDCAFGVDDFRRMRQRCGPGVGCVALQSDYEGRAELLRGRPAFDFFCTLMPIEFVYTASEDEEFLGLLGRMNRGAEFLFIDWWFRRQGCFFNILTESVLHLFVQDEHKVWGQRPQQRWDEITDGILVCSSVAEVEAFLGREGLLD